MMMHNSHRHNHNHDPYNHENRQTFVLKCDKPRYDGGVEVDLERYFGRKLQPNMQELKRAKVERRLMELLSEGETEAQNAQEAEDFIAQLSFHDVDDLPSSFTEEALTHTHSSVPLSFSQLSAMALDKANLDRVTNRRYPINQNFEEQTDFHTSHLSQATTNVVNKVQLIRQVFLQGPLQIAISLAGMVTTVVALASVGLGEKHRSLKNQSLELMQDCSSMFWKGWANTLLIPFKTMQVAFAKQ